LGSGASHGLVGLLVGDPVGLGGFLVGNPVGEYVGLRVGLGVALEAVGLDGNEDGWTLGTIKGLLEEAVDTEGWAEPCLGGAKETLGGALGCKLGTPLDIGIILGWSDGAAGMEGIADGITEGWADTLGDLDSINVGTPVLVGPMLGWRDV